MPENSISRRSFLRKTGAASAGLLTASAAQAIEPFDRAGDPRFRLSLAAYSFRNHFKHYNRGNRKTNVPAEEQIDMFDFIDYCADLGLEGAELTSYFFPRDAPDSHYLDIRRHALLRGMPVSGTAVGNNFARPKGKELDDEVAAVKQWIDRAALMGAPHIRIFAGSPPKGTSDQVARDMCIESIIECCDYAGKKGIFLGLENHGGIVAEAQGLLDIIKAVDSPWFGVNLDTGNFHTTWPYKDLASIAPYTVNVQVKIELRPRDRAREPMDMERIARILKYAGFQGYVVLEYEEGKPYEEIPGYIEKMREIFA